MSALICARCGTEIHPGENVEFVGVDVESVRIVTETDDILIVHATCPEPS